MIVSPCGKLIFLARFVPTLAKKLLKPFAISNGLLIFLFLSLMKYSVLPHVFCLFCQLEGIFLILFGEIYSDVKRF